MPFTNEEFSLSMHSSFLQPSSSARSAELLGGQSGFIGFGAVSAGLKNAAAASSTTLPPTTFAGQDGAGEGPKVKVKAGLGGMLAGVDLESATEIPSEVKVALKKMSKKDVTTKIKVSCRSSFE